MRLQGVVVALAILSVVPGSACSEGSLESSSDLVPELQLDSVPVVVIGERDGPPEYLFSRIFGLELLDDGRIAVADAGIPAVRMYDRSGTFIRQLGREGEGPGEYRYIRGFWTSAPDWIHVLDSSPSRITVFDTAGEVETTIPYEIGSIRPYGVEGTFSDGSFVFGGLGFGEGTGPIVPGVRYYARFGADGTDMGIFARGDGRWRYGAEHLGTPAGTGRIHPFSPEGAFWIRDDTAYVYDGYGPAARKIDKEGRSVGLYPLPENPTNVEVARRRLGEALEQRGRNADFGGVPWMDRMGRIAEVIVDDLGFTWARWYEPSEDSPWLWDGAAGFFDGGTWVLLDDTGDVRATVSLLDDFQLRKVRGSVLAGVTQDDLGVERVVLYEIRSERPR